MLTINWTRPMTWSLTMRLTATVTPTAESDLTVDPCERNRCHRYLAEIDDYRRRLEALGDPDVLEQASAAIWDVMLDAEMQRRKMMSL